MKVIRKWTKLLNKTEMLAVFKVSQSVKMLSRTFSSMFLRFPEDNLIIIMNLKSYFMKFEPPAMSKDVQIHFL